MSTLDDRDSQDLWMSPAVDDDGSGLQWEDEAEYATVRPASKRVLRAFLVVLALAIVGFVVYAAVGAWVGSQLDPDGGPGAEVQVLIPFDSTNSDIAEILESSNVIPNGSVFGYYTRLNNLDGFQAGQYTFQVNMSADEAVARLEAGPLLIKEGEFIVPEGLWVTEILPRVAAQIPNVSEDDLAAVLQSGELDAPYRPEDCEQRLAAEGVEVQFACWEGLLFPAKYFVEPDATAVDVLQKMTEEFARVTDELGYSGAEQSHGMSAYEVVVIASMVEAEARTDQDRPLIARVIYNRLAAGEAIGIDATNIYGAQDRQIQLTTGILESDSPYSTRSKPGLPPNPIAAPGRKSLEAAMNPAEGNMKYYVRIDDEGNHVFAETLEEHNANKARSKELGYLD